MDNTDLQDEIKIVIVSPESAPMVEIQDVPGIVIEKPADIRVALFEHIRTADDSRMHFLVILSERELAPLKAFISGFPRSALACGVVLTGVTGNLPTELMADETILDFRQGGIRQNEFPFICRNLFLRLRRDISFEEERDRHILDLLDTRNDQEALIDIGKSLTVEKDPNKLLRSILFLSKKITGADAGSIFLVEYGTGGEKLLRFRYSHTFSKELDYEEFTMPCNTNSIAGYVAETGNVLNIPDAYHLSDDSPVSFNNSFDRTHGYQTRSMLVVPMRNHEDNIIGVIQLINSKEKMNRRGVYSGNEAYEVYLENPDDFENKVVPFEMRYESLMESIAGQAAVALENSRMIKQIETQFEEFVKASVGAIESRDPATSGHSFRVASLCLALARAVNNTMTGPLADLQFSPTQLKELEFAALLHDFGKVYIDNSVFQKAKKLYPRDYDYLHMRLAFLLRSLQLVYADDPRCEVYTAEVKELIEKVAVLNEPRVIDGDINEEVNAILARQAELSVEDLEGRIIPLLTPEEEVNLRIPRGSLNDEERSIIQSHVEHTYTFVSRIPWPESFASIPDIASQHHETLNGTGYPAGLKGDQILPQSRMMAIADIFDALSASDRPYKKALPLEKVLSIVREEAERGKLDADMVDLFIREKVFEAVTEDVP